MTTSINLQGSHSSAPVTTVSEVQSSSSAPSLQSGSSAPPVHASGTPSMLASAPSQAPVLTPTISQKAGMMYSNNTSKPLTFNHKGLFKIEIQPGQEISETSMRNLESAVALARSRLDAAHGLQDDVTMRQHLASQFRLPADATEEQITAARDKVMAQVDTLRTQMNSSELTFKQMESRPETADAAAYVKREALDLIRDTVSGPSPDRPAKFNGPINIDFGKLSSTSTSAMNLVHESSHKFLGARDWAYSPNSNMVDYEHSFTSAGMAVQYPPASVNAIKAWNAMSTAEAINNADSMAGFVMHAENHA